VTTVFAHLGHLYVGLPIYMGPVILLLAWMKIGGWRDRRREKRPPPKRPPKDPDS
jgi:hypothetical protein